MRLRKRFARQSREFTAWIKLITFYDFQHPNLAVFSIALLNHPSKAC